MDRPLLFLAGDNARRTLQTDGFDPLLVQSILGASGGPKWFVLSQLDRVIAARLLPALQGPVHLLGSSIGAWRMACYASEEPVAAIERLETSYVEQEYSAQASGAQILDVARNWLMTMFGDDGIRQVIESPRFRLHVIAARARGLAAVDRRLPLSLGLAAAAAGNLFSRRQLARHFDRYCFSDPREVPPFLITLNPAQGGTVPLTQDNLVDVILASSAIPLLMPGVADIPGAPPGLYRDGGIVDYHLDLPSALDGTMALYPHFGPRLVPGWFDKNLRWRRVQAVNHRNTLVLCPSPAFIASLPGGKIPDRTDFKRYDPATRVRVWRESIARCEALAEDFERVWADDRWAERVQPLDAV